MSDPMDKVESGRRLRQSVKPDYLAALGMATWSFASLEWQVVWCCERIKPGSLRKIVDDEMTAGTIAIYFKEVARNMPRSKTKVELQRLAESFLRLKDLRNDILHGKPCTGPNGESRLSKQGVIEIPDLEAAADAFATCGGDLNALYYAVLWKQDETKPA